MSLKGNEDPTTCQDHKIAKSICNQCNKYMCKICVFKDKESINHWYDHYESIQFTSISPSIQYKQYKIYEKLNRISSQLLTEAKEHVNNLFKDFDFVWNLKTQMKDELHVFYRDFIEMIKKQDQDFKLKVERLILTEADINEVYKIEKEYLDFKNLLLNRSKLNGKFEEVFNHYSKILSSISLNRGISLKISTLKNESNEEYLNDVFKVADCIDYTNSSNSHSKIDIQQSFNKVKISRRNMTFNFMLSEKLLDTNSEPFTVLFHYSSLIGPYVVEIKIADIDSKRAEKFWCYAFGVQDASEKYSVGDGIGPLLKSSVFIQSNGWLCEPRTVNGKFKKICNTLTANTVIYIQKDFCNALWFSQDKENWTFLADKIDCESKICFVYNHNSVRHGSINYNLDFIDLRL